jgi:hypothetical protein
LAGIFANKKQAFKSLKPLKPFKSLHVARDTLQAKHAIFVLVREIRGYQLPGQAPFAKIREIRGYIFRQAGPDRDKNVAPTLTSSRNRDSRGSRRMIPRFGHRY